MLCATPSTLPSSPVPMAPNVTAASTQFCVVARPLDALRAAFAAPRSPVMTRFTSQATASPATAVSMPGPAVHPMPSASAASRPPRAVPVRAKRHRPARRRPLTAADRIGHPAVREANTQVGANAIRRAAAIAPTRPRRSRSTQGSPTSAAPASAGNRRTAVSPACWSQKATAWASKRSGTYISGRAASPCTARQAPRAVVASSGRSGQYPSRVIRTASASAAMSA